tara:strand:+ start:12904 stop:13920 length:1017 start_codon:yes stop_codon:yes gene_type:complete
MDNNKINFALIGFGYWGRNIARNIANNADSRLKYIVDSSEHSLSEASNIYEGTSFETEIDKVLSDQSVNVVGIFTPPSTHYKLIISSIKAGKHVLVTKPLCLDLNEAFEIRQLANERNIQIFVDDTFLFSGPVEFLKQYFSKSSFGDLVFIQSSRINLGLMQKDCNVIWDLAPHDIGILNHLLEDSPKKVRATGFNPYSEMYPYECHSTCDLIYDNNLHASITLSWLSSIKTRRMIFGGTNETVVYDHLDQNAQIKIFKQSISSVGENSDLQFEYSIGDEFIPQVDNHEPLAKEIEMIISTLKSNTSFPANLDHAIETVKVIEGLQNSLKLDGEVIAL